MSYIVHKLQNVSGWSNQETEVEIDENDPNWEQALNDWKNGKNPTNSKFWKKGIFALSKLNGACNLIG